jgi:hypothetical protein
MERLNKPGAPEFGSFMRSHGRRHRLDRQVVSRLIRGVPGTIARGRHASPKRQRGRALPRPRWRFGLVFKADGMGRDSYEATGLAIAVGLVETRPTLRPVAHYCVHYPTRAVAAGAAARPGFA